MKRRARLFPAAFLATLVSLPASAQPDKPPDEPRRVERLAALGRLWGTVKFLHPWLAYKDVDWDMALVQAISKSSAAKDAAEYAAAVSGMLAALGDPATELVKAQEADAFPDKRTLVISWPRESVLYARLNKQANWGVAAELTAARVLGTEIDKAEAVVLDLREAGSVEQIFQEIGPRLVSRPLRGPARRHLLHSGYRPQEGTTSAGHFSSFVSPAAETFSPRPDAKPRRVVFVLGPRSPLPGIALALLAEGQASLVAEGPADDLIAVEREPVALADGWSALVRMQELQPLRGWSGPRADVALGAGEDALEAALRLLDQPAGVPRKTGPAPPLPDFVFRPDRKYPEMTYPSREYRLLALFRFWNVIDRFYPCKQLIEEWGPVLPEFIPRFEAARDAREYALVVAELAARVADSHTRVFGSPALNEFFGAAAPPIGVRVIAGQLVVTEIDDGAATPDAIAVGDVVLEVDGETVSQRMKRFERYVAASTREWRTQRLAQLALRGPAGSIAVLSLQGKDGQPKQLRVARGGPAKPRPGAEPWERSVPDNLGYVDLRVLGVEQVDAMFEALQDTKGILFDMRGYPQGTAAAIAARLNTRAAKYGASFYRELVAPGERTRLFFQQELPRTDKWKYTGRSVMLIDDRAISEAERTGLFLEAAADTRFVGSRSAGADGELTRFVLPGGLVVFMTGQEVRHADGRQLQRIGLVPHVEVRPTLQGIRDGRDEVLERAMRYLRDGS